MAINLNSAKVLTTNLVFNLDAENTSSYSGTGNTWSDLSDNSNNATLVNNPTFIDTSPKHFDLDGVDDYINMGNIDLRRNFTLEGWFYLDGGTYFGFFGQGTSSTNAGLHISYYNNSRGILHALWGNDNDYHSNFRPSYKKWYHFVFTYNHTTYNKQFYADGVLINPAASVENQYNGTGNLLIGANLSSAINKINGKVAVARMYNKVLSATEIRDNYNSLAPRFSKPLINTVDMYLGSNKLKRVYSGATELYNNQRTPFVQEGLQLYLDPGDTNSYPGTGNNWYDLSGNDRHFSWDTTSWDNSGYFNVGSRVATPIDYTPSWSFGINNTTGYTIIVAYYINNLSSNSLFKFYSSNGTDAQNRGIFIHPSWSNGTIYFDQGGCCTAYQRLTYSTVSTGNWYVVGLRSSIYNRHILLNSSGVVSSTSTIATNINLNTTVPEIGATESAFDGRIGVFAAYNRAITNEEFSYNFNSIKEKYNLT